ncbi:MAG: zinc-dependent metalloprotease [Xanthomonadales bacterium]|nr:zinc-dependent metalloprotease [Xanthomonadales bacterium]
MKPLKLIKCLIVLGVLALPQVLVAESKDKNQKEEEEKTVKELIKDKTNHQGFLQFYQDPKTGEMLLSLSEDEFDKPMIYFVHTVNGVLEAGHFKGAFKETKLLEFRKRFNRIEIISKTPRYVFGEEQAINRSRGTNISAAVLASMEIKAFDEQSGQYVVEVDPVFLSESLHRVSPYPKPATPDKPPPPPEFTVGKLSKEKTKYLQIKSYPKNSDVIVEYVFDNEEPSVRGGLEITDPRSIIIQMQHSFIALPEDDFIPRKDDPRIGYFAQQFDDLNSNKWAPYRDVINRWKLVKKDPNAALSEPVEPIVWWIENTTPLEWRETIKEATLQWNIAFEEAGFKNALQVKVQPDDADWDAGDIRYNVMRWTASPKPPFGGYGPSVANPLTGQIIAADIMLEYAFIKRRQFIESIYSGEGALNSSMPGSSPGFLCSAGFEIGNAVAFASAVLNTNGSSSLEKHKLTEEGLTFLILHELGHTLGLNHNMKASQLYDSNQVHDASITQGSITASVMDYAPINLAPPGVTQGDYADTRPGSYDTWAIEYGYSQALPDAEKEEQRLNDILSRSTQPQLAFGNDADDMRAPGRHIDPRVMTGDMSNDAIEYAREQMELVKATFANLKTSTTHQGESYQELTVGVNVLIRSYFGASNVISRYIGGVYIDRAMVGQNGATQPYTPVSLEDQKRAMKTLNEYIFAPNVLTEVEPLYAYLQIQRRGFNNHGKNEDPKLHEILLKAQQNIFAHLLHENVLQRLTDSSLYGNEYSVNQMLSDLTKGVFEADRKTDVTTQRQNLQHEYVKQLIIISGLDKPSTFDYISQSAAADQLRLLKNIGKHHRAASVSTVAHRNYLRNMIEQAFNKS